MKKGVWLINQYASTPKTGMGGRHYYLAAELARMGEKVTVVSSSYSHLLSCPPTFSGLYCKEVNQGVTYLWLKGVKYKKVHGVGRVLNWLLFSLLLLFLPLIMKERPKTILYSSPSLIGALSALLLSRILRSKFIFEVRDIWPLTLITVGNFSEKNIFIRMLSAIERLMYRSADELVSNLPYAYEHMVKNGADKSKFTWIPNGICLGEVTSPQVLPNNISQSVPTDKFIVGYVGTVGLANALLYLVEAAEELASITDIHFVIVGAGQQLPSLQQLAKDKRLSNISFISAVPKKQVQSMLRKFDVCYIGWKNEGLYRYGISPNKLPEYMFSGRPVLHSFSGKGDLVALARCGITVEAESSSEIASAVSDLYKMSKKQRTILGQNGLKFVEAHLTYQKVAVKLASVL